MPQAVSAVEIIDVKSSFEVTLKTQFQLRSDTPVK